MIIRDLYIIGIAIDEAKADPPLVINGNGKLACSITLERMKSITRWHTQIIQICSKLNVFEPTQYPFYQIRWQALRFTSHKKLLRFTVGKGLNHQPIVTRDVTMVKCGRSSLNRTT